MRWWGEILQAMMEELGQSGEAKVRFEFNEVPEVLERALVSFVGYDNPHFEWKEVPMEGERASPVGCEGSFRPRALG